MMHPRRLEDQREEGLAADYVGGMSRAALAEKYGVSEGTVKNALKRQQVETRSRAEVTQKCRLPLDEEGLIADYLKGLSLEDTATKHSCSSVTVRNVLIRHNVPRRSVGAQVRPVLPTKTCSVCGQTLLRASFYGEGRRTSECIRCTSERQKDTYHGNALVRKDRIARAKKSQESRPEAVRAYKRNWHSGWTAEAFELAWEEQGGACDVCHVLMKKTGQGATSVHADHDHKTGLPRGLLCHTCNTQLGSYEKKHEVFALYLQKHVGRS